MDHKFDIEALLLERCSKLGRQSLEFLKNGIFDCLLVLFGHLLKQGPLIRKLSTVFPCLRDLHLDVALTAGEHRSVVISIFFEQELVQRYTLEVVC